MTAERFMSNPAELRQLLTDAGALRFQAYPSGLFPASDLPPELGDATEMNMAWFRDNAHVANALYESGQHELALPVGRAMLTVLHANRALLDDVVSGRNPYQRLPVRVRGADLAKDREARRQNDSTGYAFWFVSKLIADGAMQATPEDLDTLAQTVRYLKAIELWHDADEGHWEEDRRIHASSIGVAVAGLREAQRAFGSQDAELPFDEMIAKGSDALYRILDSGVTDLPPDGDLAEPAPPSIGDNPNAFNILHRKYDAALLFLVKPLGVLDDAHAQKVVADVEQHLVRAHGTARYEGDTYWSPRFPYIMSIEERTRAAEGRIEARNQKAEGIAYTQTEAQWTLFDSLLSEYYGERYAQTGSDDDRAKQLHYLNRSLAQFVMTPEGPRLPESFYYEFDNGEFQWIPNDHTPLLWSQANLLRALLMFERTTAQPSGA